MKLRNISHMARNLRAVGDPGRDADGAELTIEQLAHATGMTVRNIRAHQSRGLLPPPEVRARTGYYGPDHVARLQLIQDMQADGFNLSAIKQLVEGTDGAANELLGLRRALTTPFEAETPEVLTGEDLVERFGDRDERSLQKAERLGLLRPLGGDRWEAPSPALIRAAEEVMAQGASLRTALAVVEQMKRHCEGVARSFVRLFLDEVWGPFQEAGYPEDRWSEVVESIDRLRPLASEALLATFGLTMTQAVEDAFGKELERARKRGR